ncbi:dATP/dGTP pyrophosphohydrolase domain-containing protein [Citrobacter freundii]|uniref:dATP/dGTP pyrophosphohydrolase domain-containing protein n=1 Tax=Citrobacter freundii TaxID=546 RepID=UPI00387E5035
MMNPVPWLQMTNMISYQGLVRTFLSDEQITQAMVEKLAINKQREWPEPKDGEPRLHIKKAGNSPVIPDGWVMVPVEPTMAMLDEFDSIIDYGAEDSKDAWSRLIAAALQR